MPIVRPGEHQIEPAIAAVGFGREHEVRAHRSDVHHLTEQVLARAIVSVGFDVPAPGLELLQYPRQVPEIAGQCLLAFHRFDPAGLGSLVHQAHRPGKEAQADAFQKVPGAPASPHRPGIERAGHGAAQAGHRLLGRAGEPQRFRDIVGGPPRQDRERHAPPDHALGDVAYGSVAADHQDQVAGIVQHVLPSLLPGRAVGDGEALVAQQPDQPIAVRPADPGIGVLDHGDVGRGARVVTH